jgi:hypothetical protein
MRGVSPSSRHVGRGMRWTRRRQGEGVALRTRGFTGSARRSLLGEAGLRTVKSCGSDAAYAGVGSAAVRCRPTVTTSSLHREEHEASRKAIAQGMSVCSPLTCMLVCANAQIFGTRDRGCSAHPAPLRPRLSRGTTNLERTRARTCRGIAGACSAVRKNPYSAACSSGATRGKIIWMRVPPPGSESRSSRPPRRVVTIL